MMQAETDYIIVGAGSAGSVLAARLSDDPSVSVTLLEAGPADDSYTIRMPAAVSINIKGSRYNWQYRSEPQSALNDRRLYQPRGKVLGGSSSLNGMIYIRGHAYDYDGWAKAGCAGWSYADVLPYFKKIESFEDGEDLYRGASGPIPVRRGQLSSPLHQAFIEAGQQAGHPFSADVNGFQQAGMSFFDKNIAKGERWSAARGYLEPRRGQSNLTILTEALASRLVIESGRATGVDYVRKGVVHRLSARREIILCAGTFGSPKLLLLSGIGPADELKALGLPVVHDLPGVGRNLQDHTEVHVQYRCTEPITLFRDLQPLRRLYAGVRWFMSRTGQAATNHYDTGAFLSTDAAVAHPDMQLHFVPIVYNNSVERRVDCHGFRVHAGPMRPKSRGSLKLRSSDPNDPPLIQPNYFAEPDDWRDMRRIIAISRDIFAKRAFDRYRGPEMSPGSPRQSNAELDDFIREWGDTGYHPAGTCRMGIGDDAVVSPDAYVRGIAALRVVDASIMPTIVSGNLNAPVMMMAELMADRIRGAAPLPAISAPVYETARREREQASIKEGALLK
jgi:choline dehydrogenase